MKCSYCEDNPSLNPSSSCGALIEWFHEDEDEGMWMCTRSPNHEGDHVGCSVKKHGAIQWEQSHTQFADKAHTRERLIGMYLEQVKLELEMLDNVDHIVGLLDRAMELREKQ